MVEKNKLGLFNPQEVEDLKIKGLSLERHPGEGFIIKGFGQVFLLTSNESNTTLGFQSPTDFNKVELHQLKLDVPYSLGKNRYIKTYRMTDSEEIVFKLDFPYECKIFRQEATSITQNLIRPI